MSKWLVVIVTIGMLALAHRRAHAQGSPATFPDVGGGVEIAAGVALLPPAIIDTVYVAKHERGGALWPALGIGCGVVGASLGLAYALPNGSSSDSNAEAKIGLGWGLVVEGTYNLGMAIWALTLPREVRASPTAMAKHRPRWTVTPLVMRDVAGRRADGLALDVHAF